MIQLVGPPKQEALPNVSAASKQLGAANFHLDHTELYSVNGESSLVFGNDSCVEPAVFEAAL